MPNLKPIDHVPEEGEKRLLCQSELDVIRFVVAQGNHLKADVINALADTIDACKDEIRLLNKDSSLLERLDF